MSEGDGMNAVLDWILGNPKLLTVTAALILAVIEAWRQKAKGKGARDAVDFLNEHLREQGYTRPAVTQDASAAIQKRGRRKAALLRELQGSDLRLDSERSQEWVDEQIERLRQKGGQDGET